MTEIRYCLYRAHSFLTVLENTNYSYQDTLFVTEIRHCLYRAHSFLTVLAHKKRKKFVLKLSVDITSIVFNS